MSRAARLRSVLACARCRGELRWTEGSATCASCGATYSLEDGIPILLPESQAAPELDDRWYPGARGVLPERLQRALQPYRSYLRPSLTYKSRRAADIVRRFADTFGPDDLVLNIGAGSTDYGSHVVNLEIEPGDGVDVVGVAEELPFADEAFAGVILMAVLEHVQDEARTLSEARRVLAPGGRLLIDVPFLQGYHPSPADYRRYTEQGLRAEVERRGFEVLESGVAVGPASAMAWTASEFFALLLSGRSSRAYRLAKLVTTWVAQPIKYADRWLEGHPMAYTIASATWVLARRPEEPS